MDPSDIPGQYRKDIDWIQYLSLEKVGPAKKWLFQIFESRFAIARTKRVLKTLKTFEKHAQDELLRTICESHSDEEISIALDSYNRRKSSLEGEV